MTWLEKREKYCDVITQIQEFQFKEFLNSNLELNRTQGLIFSREKSLEEFIITCLKSSQMHF